MAVVDLEEAEALVAAGEDTPLVVDIEGDIADVAEGLRRTRMGGVSIRGGRILSHWKECKILEWRMPPTSYGENA